MQKLLLILRYCLVMSYIISPTAFANTLDWIQPEIAPFTIFFSQENPVSASPPTPEYVGETTLPSPYDFLLTQPVMTLGIANYYQRTPKIRTPLYVISNPGKKSFYRAVIMIVDNNKQRDDALVADKQGESTIVELGLLTVNLAAVPTEVLNDMANTQIPFGALLTNHHIATHSINRYYFKIRCDATLAEHLQCNPGDMLYGRTNMLIRNDTQQWIAQVVEILTGRAIPPTKQLTQNGQRRSK